MIRLPTDVSSLLYSKACIDQLNVKAPNVKDCYEKFDKSNISKTYSCVQEKFSSISDGSTLSKCIPDALKNLLPK